MNNEKITFEKEKTALFTTPNANPDLDTLFIQTAADSLLTRGYTHFLCDYGNAFGLQCLKVLNVYRSSQIKIIGIKICGEPAAIPSFNAWKLIEQLLECCDSTYLYTIMEYLQKVIPNCSFLCTDSDFLFTDGRLPESMIPYYNFLLYKKYCPKKFIL